MFKGLSGFKKAVKGGISAVAENTSSLAEQVASDPALSRSQIKENLKNLAKGGAASVVEHGGTVLSSEQAGHSKDKAKEYAHNVKHYGAFAEDYLGFDDPNKDLRKAVKAKEKAAKKARKANKKRDKAEGKKGKKGKGEDLFDPANLAKYKKELEEKRKAAEEAAAQDTDTDDDDKAKSDAEDEAEGGLNLDLARPTKDHSTSEENSAAPSPARSRVTSPKDDTEDWKKFLDLTSGVDSLIQKSKDELAETKKTSYYQAKKEKLHDCTREAREKKSKHKKKAWVDLDTESFEDHEGEVFDEKERQKELAKRDGDSSSESEEGGEKVDEADEGDQEAQEDQEKEADEADEGKKKLELFKEPSVEEYVDQDEEDALFNTDFVTDITTGKVQLAVIPDDPIFDDGEDDPFDTDTAVVRKIVKEEEQKKKKEVTRLKFTGLSNVADVLSGKAQKLDPSANQDQFRTKRRRANRINLIGDDASAVTAVEEIASVSKAEGKDDTTDILGDLGLGASDAVPEGDLLASVVSPAGKGVSGEGEKEGKKAFDLSEFDEIGGDSKTDLTSNIAILAGEFTQAAEEEEDDFDAAFDALAQDSVTKQKLVDFERQFENEDDIFDTSNADKVLKLASLLDKVEDDKEKNAAGEIDEAQFEDPFDTSAYDNIVGQAEEELDFDALVNRDVREQQDVVVDIVVKDAGEDAFGSTPNKVSAGVDEGWAAFEGNKPKRPPPPVRPNRPPRAALDPSDNPGILVRGPSTESVKSWNVSVAERLIGKEEGERRDTLREEEEEYDPFDTKGYGEENDGAENEEDDIDDPFAVPDAVNELVEQVQEAKRQDELASQPVDLLGDRDDAGGGDTLTPVSKDLTNPEVDPFDTDFAADVLPNKGDPFETGHISGDLCKAEIEEFLAEPEFDPRTAEGTAVPKKNLPGQAGRARPRGASGELSVKVPSEDKEEVEEDPFDTSIVDKVVPVRRAEKRTEISVEDDEFDPTATFKKSKEITQSISEEPDPFDTSVAINALPEEERQAELERSGKEAEEKAKKEEERLAEPEVDWTGLDQTAKGTAVPKKKVLGVAGRARPRAKAKEPSPDVSDDDFDPRG